MKWIIQYFSSNANFSFSFIPGCVNGTFTVSWTNLKGQSKNLVISYWKVNTITWHCITWKTFPADALDNTVPFINLLHYLLWSEIWSLLTKSITAIYPCPDGRWSSIPNTLKKETWQKPHCKHVKTSLKWLKTTQEKWKSEKKNLAENLQVFHERMMELEFKTIKYMGLEERLQMTKRKIYVCSDLYTK